jgi:hypothetical protein
MKRQRTYVYHTKLLVPDYVAKEAQSAKDELEIFDILTSWQEKKRSDHHFTRGDVCYHIDDIWQLLHVDKIIRSFPKKKNGEPQKTKIDGIQCHWHEESS